MTSRILVIAAGLLTLSACDDAGPIEGDPDTDAAASAGKADGATEPEGEPDLPDAEPGPFALQCWDQTFAYNVVTAFEDEDGIEIVISGASLNVIDLHEDVGWSNDTIRMVFDRDACVVSPDGTLVSCASADLPVTRDGGLTFTENGAEEFEDTTVIIAWATVDLSYVTRLNASGINQTGFELRFESRNEDFEQRRTEFFINDDDNFTMNCRYDPDTFSFNHL